MRHLYLIFFLLLTGCYDWNENMQRSRMEEIDRLAEQAKQRDNKPNEYNYKLGMQDGCESGKFASGTLGHKQSKNVDLYVNNAYYKNGYDDAYDKCKTEGDQLKRAITDSLNRGW